MTTIAVYGSLKKGKYNHDILRESKHLGNSTIKGTLYRVSSYPALLKEGEDVYDVELYEVEDNVYQSIKMMELGAGYIEEKVKFNINGDDVEAIVYFAGERLTYHCKEYKEKISSY